jgi:hypothetical protein
MKQLLLHLFRPTWQKLSLLMAALLITALYIHVFPSPTLTYVGAVLVHAGIGIVAVGFLLPKLREIFSLKHFRENVGWMLVVVGAGFGIALFFTGTSRPQWKWMYMHEAFSFTGVALLAAWWVGAKGWLTQSRVTRIARYALFLGLAAVLGFGGWKVRQTQWLHAYKPTDRATHYGWGRRWSQRAVFPKLSANGGQRANPK